MATETTQKETIKSILTTDLMLLKQLKQLFLHQRTCIAGRNTQSLQESSQLMDEIATGTEQNNQEKTRHLHDIGIMLSDSQPWETVAESLITHISATGVLPVADIKPVRDLLDAVKALSKECRNLCRDNQKTMVTQMTLTGKMLNRLRGPSLDNGSAYGTDGSTRMSSDSLSLAMA